MTFVAIPNASGANEFRQPDARGKPHCGETRNAARGVDGQRYFKRGGSGATIHFGNGAV